MTLFLAGGTEVHTTTQGAVTIQGREFRLVIRTLSPGLRAALQGLIGAGTSEDTLADMVRSTDGVDGLMRWYSYLQRLDSRGVLGRAVCCGERRLATLLPCSPRFRFPGLRVGSSGYVLSRFACVRRLDDVLIVESPRALAHVVLHDHRVTGLICFLAQAREPAELADACHDLPAGLAIQLLELLLNAGMLEAVDQAGAGREDSDPALQCWQFHDLLFHARSRLGRHNQPVARDYPSGGHLTPPPALKPPMSGETIELPRPDIAHLEQHDPPFEAVLRQRRSIRAYGREPINMAQLGEFLYRVGRVTDMYEAEVNVAGHQVPVVIAARPYPCGGAQYEMELYVVVNSCTGLLAGLYHYEPLGHRLEVLAPPSLDRDALLADAALAAGVPPASLQVLIVLSARFQRIMWKYSGIAYALTLKHVGVLFESMYLVASAMGLAPCGLGGGDSETFANAAGLDYYSETSVGEFLLGSRGSEDNERLTASARAGVSSALPSPPHP